MARLASSKASLVHAECGGSVAGVILAGGVEKMVQEACLCGMTGVAQIGKAGVVIPAGSRCGLA